MQPTIALSSPMAHAFFHQHPDAVLVLDAMGNVMLANAAAAWLASGDGYPNFAQMSGVAWPGDEKGELDSGRRWSRRLRIQARDGSSRQADVSLFGVERVEHEPQLFYCAVKDVTASVTAARASQEVESRSRVTSDAAPVLVWMSGPDAMCEWFNKSWLAFRGRTLGDEIGEGWTEGVHPEDLERCLGIYSHCFEQREPFSMDVRMLRNDGRYRWMLDTGVPRFGADGEFLGFIGTCVDISDRKELEDKLAEHTRNLRLGDRRREEFLARLSHELRNPLGPIANAAAILKALERNDTRLVKVREIIERQVAQLNRLITDLVDVSRITKGRVVLQRQRTDAQAVLDGALEQVQPELAQRPHAVHVERAQEPLPLVGDAQRLAQALAALIGNAIKFSPVDSTIGVTLRANGTRIEYVVEDQGCGIAPTFLPHVFELFTQSEQSLARSEGGLGVGLTIAKSIAELHGGSIEVDSAGHGLGTTAMLRVPMTEARTLAAIDDSDLARVEGCRVLVIEDNTDARESLRLRFELSGNEVRTAAGAAEGLRIAQDFEPDLVVCDIGLPDVDGYELVRKLKDSPSGQETRFVALTGYGRVEDRDRALDSGFDAFLVKPLQTV